MKKPQKPATLGRTPRLLFTGFSMGLADLVPGVSGGTIAFLYGIYDELLYSIKQVTGSVPKLVLKGRIGQAIKDVPFAFLVPVFVGMLTAIFGLSHLITYLLEEHPVPTWSLFFGLVIGSAFVVSKRVSQWNLNRYALLATGTILTYLIVGLPELGGSSNPLAIFVAGSLAFCAMILPGISGSLILVILGQYKNVLNAVGDRNFVLLGYLLAGGIVGLALFSRLLSWLLKNHHGAVIAFLTGMMLGSLRKVWPWQTGEETNAVNALPELNVMLLVSVLIGAIGFVLVWQLEKLGIVADHDDIDDQAFKKEIANPKNT